MDTGTGRFEMFTVPEEKKTASDLERLVKAWEGHLHVKYPNHGGTFSEGEELEIKGSRFRIARIINNGLKLELLPR
jgi:hypothetical protein